MRLIQGDCLEKMKDIEDGSVDMVMCDYDLVCNIYLTLRTK